MHEKMPPKRAGFSCNMPSQVPGGQKVRKTALSLPVGNLRSSIGQKITVFVSYRAPEATGLSAGYQTRTGYYDDYKTI